ncbi:MAG: hypothetical protein EB121_09290, partial [Alphaproteobacteria bacterium]|nr:hypothetical protein [Alphaproteobacteria bacterium]
ATSITNSFINRAGSQFVFRAMEKTGQNAVAVTRAYVIARDSYQLASYWRAIESLDNVAPAAVQAELFLYTERLLSYVVPWILRETKVTQPFEKQIDDLGSACQKMRTWLDENTPVSAKVNASQLIAQKVPEPLAKTAALIPLLSAAPDVHWLSQKYNVSIAQGSALFFSVGDRFNFSWLREKCRASAQNTQWQRDAISGLIEDLFITQRMLCGKILSSHRKQWHDPAAWFAGSTRLQAIDHTMNELRHSTAIDFAGLALMARQLGLLAYAKIWLFDQLLASNLPDDPWLKGDLLRYFPKKMSDKFSRDIAQHQLAREIIATSITNSFINRAGSQFVFRAMEKTGQNAVAVTR